MSELLKQGLEVSLLGMGMTFAALGLLILTMALLERLFRPASSLSEERLPELVTSTEGASQAEEIATAIAIALAYFESKDTGRNALGATLERERGRWWGRGQTTGSSRRPKWRIRRQRQDE